MDVRMRRTVAVVLALVAMTLSACAPTPAPTPTPTGFASEEEAFAAAEATYRAYVDALNAVDLADPTTFEPVRELTAGAARSNISKELSEMHAKRWSVEGATIIRAVAPIASEDDVSVTLNVCADVSGVSLVDSDGASVVAPDRPPVQPLTIVVSADTNGFAVSSVTGRTDGEPRC